MILETATISVTPGSEEDFLAAVDGPGRAVLAQAEGWQAITIHRSIERPSVFMLAIVWATLEAHTEGFRGGPLFTQWRAVIGPFFAEPPQVEHWISHG